MLTKNDLQQIRTAVREEIQEELDTVRTSLSFLKIDITSLKTSTLSLKSDATSIKKKLDKVSKDVDTLIPYFNKRITSLEKDMRNLKQN